MENEGETVITMFSLEMLGGNIPKRSVDKLNIFF